jgi:hypothetical protein
MYDLTSIKVLNIKVHNIYQASSKTSVFNLSLDLIVGAADGGGTLAQGARGRLLVSKELYIG